MAHQDPTLTPTLTPTPTSTLTLLRLLNPDCNHNCNPNPSRNHNPDPNRKPTLAMGHESLRALDTRAVHPAPRGHPLTLPGRVRVRVRVRVGVGVEVGVGVGVGVRGRVRVRVGGGVGAGVRYQSAPSRLSNQTLARATTWNLTPIQVRKAVPTRTTSGAEEASWQSRTHRTETEVHVTTRLLLMVRSRLIAPVLGSGSGSGSGSGLVLGLGLSSVFQVVFRAVLRHRRRYWLERRVYA